MKGWALQTKHSLGLLFTLTELHCIFSSPEFQWSCTDVTLPLWEAGSFLRTQVLSLEISSHLYNLHPCNKSLWMAKTAEYTSNFYEIKPLGKTHEKKPQKTTVGKEWFYFEVLCILLCIKVHFALIYSYVCEQNLKRDNLMQRVQWPDAFTITIYL